MWQKQKVVNAIILLAVDVCRSRQFKHFLQADRRLLTFVVAFTNKSGPHGVVQFGC